MEQQFKKDILSSSIKKAGIESVSNDFDLKVLNKITAKEQSVRSTPLISAKGWLIFLAVIVISAALLFFFPSEISFRQFFKTDLNTNFKWEFSSLKSSQITLYAFVFLSLFLIQIPILRRYTDRR